MEKEMEKVPPWKRSGGLAVPDANHLLPSFCAPVSDQNPRVTLVSQKPSFSAAMGGKALVCITLIFDGSWVFEGGRWVFKREKAHKNVMIQESIDFTSFKKLIMVKVDDDALYEERALCYMLKSKEGGHPITIADDDDLEAFKFLNSKSGEHPWSMAIYVGPLRKESFEVKQAIGEECLSGTPASKKVDEVDEVVICEAKGKSQLNPVSIDDVLCAEGWESEVIVKTKDLVLMDISDMDFRSSDTGMCSCDRGKYPDVIKLGGTDNSSSDMEHGLEGIAISSEDEDGSTPELNVGGSNNGDHVGVKLEEEWEDLEWHDVVGDKRMRVSVEGTKVEDEVMMELEDCVPRSSAPPPTMEIVEVMVYRITPHI